MSMIYLLYFAITIFVSYAVLSVVLKSIKKKNLTYISRNDFPIDISFELVKEGSLKRFLGNFFGGRAELEVGDLKFDSKVYISSDIDVIKKVLKNPNIKEIILEILADKNINGIYVDSKEIYIASKIFDKKSKYLYFELEQKYNPYLDKLKNMLVEEISKIRVDEDDRKFTKNIKEKIEKLKTFYMSLVVTGLIFLFYFCIADKDIYINLEYFSLGQLFFSTLSVLVPVIAFSLYKTKGSSRRHLLFGTNSWALVLGCFLSGFFLLYFLNIYLDRSEPKISTESFHKKYERAHRSTNYYLYLDSANNPDLEKYSRIKIAVTKYMTIPRDGEINITMKKGYFNTPYISIKNK